MSDEPLIPSDWIRCPEPGVVVRRPLSNDRYADLCMMIMGGAELKIGRKYDLGYEEIYTYAHWFWGFEALLSWNPDSGEEPTGWIRHQPSNRRRAGGDPEKETIRP